MSSMPLCAPQRAIVAVSDAEDVAAPAAVFCGCNLQLRTAAVPQNPAALRILVGR